MLQGCSITIASIWKFISYCNHGRILPCNKVVITFIMFIESKSNFKETLWIHIWLTKTIYEPIRLPNHVLIILQRLTIFCIWKYIGYDEHGQIPPCNKMIITFITFVPSKFNFTVILWIHIWLRKIIHDPIDLSDHVLIISLTLEIVFF